MPTMANITVKKYDGTTDVVYTALTASGGDSSPARWALTAASTIAAQRPRLSMSTRFNGKQDARQIAIDFIYPVYDVDDVLIGTIPFRVTGTIGQQIDDSSVQEAVAQFTNLVDGPLLNSAMISGYSPT